MDENTTSEIGKEYDFTLALLEDYSNCKTDIARSGLLKAIQLVVENLKKQHEDAVLEIADLKNKLSTNEPALTEDKSNDQCLSS